MPVKKAFIADESTLFTPMERVIIACLLEKLNLLIDEVNALRALHGLEPHQRLTRSGILADMKQIRGTLRHG